MASNVSVIIKSTGADVATKEIRGIGDAGRDAAVHIEKTGGALEGLKSGLGGIAQIASGIGLEKAVERLPGLIMGSTAAASELNESLSKSQSVFGSGFGAIEKFANGAADAVGLSKQKAYEATGTFGNLFDQLKIGGAQSADMSTSMVTLAGDFASFHNADISDVIAAQTAAFRGEYDALQRFVPTINAAAVETEALSETGKKNAKELTAQEKALATYALMVNGAGKATGDFQRTKDGDANSTRILQAKMEDLNATIGAKLLPVQIKAKQLMIDAIPVALKYGDLIADKLAPGFEYAAENADKLVPPLLAAANVGLKLYGIFGPLAEGIGVELVDAVNELIPPIRDDLVPALKEASPIFEKIGIFAAAVAVGPLYLLLQAVKLVTPWVGDYLVLAIKILSAEISAGVKVYDGMVTGLGFIAGAAGKAKDGIGTFVGIVKGIPGQVGDLGGLLKQKGIDLVDGFFAGAKEFWDDPAKGVATVVGFVISIPTKLLALDKLLFDKGADLVLGLFGGAKSIWDDGSKGVAWLVGIVLTIPEKVGDLGKLLWEKGGDVVSGLMGGAKSLWDDEVAGWKVIWGFVQSIPDKIGDVGKLLLDKGKAIIAGLFEGIGKGMAENGEGLKSVLNGIIGMVNKVKIPGIKIPDWVPEIGGKGWDGWSPDIKPLAAGTTNWGGGMALVGEKGPELVNLPRGAQVFSNAESRRMGGGVTINIDTVHARNEGEARTAAGNIAFALAARGWARL